MTGLPSNLMGIGEGAMRGSEARASSRDSEKYVQLKPFPLPSDKK